jgi:hypothetical protein
MIHRESETYKSLVRGAIGARKEIELWVTVSRIGPEGKRCPHLPFKSGIAFDFPKRRKLENRVTFEQSYQIKNSQVREGLALKGINGNVAIGIYQGTSW